MSSYIFNGFTGEVEFSQKPPIIQISDQFFINNNQPLLAIPATRIDAGAYKNQQVQIVSKRFSDTDSRINTYTIMMSYNPKTGLWLKSGQLGSAGILGGPDLLTWNITTNGLIGELEYDSSLMPGVYDAANSIAYIIMSRF